MSSVPDSSPALSLRPKGAAEAVLYDSVEQLSDASDAASVLNICIEAIHRLGIRGHVHWRPTSEPSDPTALDLARDAQGLRTLVLDDPGALDPVLRDQLAWLGRLVTSRLRQQAETSRLYEAISRLALAERLQRALYAIAEQAGSTHSMPEMMRSLHAIVASLMYAENFFIVLYDASTGTVRYPYFVDTADPQPPLPEQDIPLQDIHHSLTWNLLKSSQPIMGSMPGADAAVRRSFRTGRTSLRTLPGRAAAARWPRGRRHRDPELSHRYALHDAGPRTARLRGAARADRTGTARGAVGTGTPRGRPHRGAACRQSRTAPASAGTPAWRTPANGVVSHRRTGQRPRRQR
nr:hypothetical protein [Rhodanobacter sp. 115]